MECATTILDNAAVGIAAACNGVITRCNPCCEEIFGYIPGELVGFNERALFFSEDDYAQAVDLVETATRGFCGEMRLLKKSGGHFWCALSGTKVSIATTPNTNTIVWTFQDIDERKQTELTRLRMQYELEAGVEQRAIKLEEANRLLQSEMQARRRIEEKHRAQQSEMARVARINTAGEMVSALAHELGQPLAAMQNYAHGCLLRMATGNATPSELRQGLVQAIRYAEQAGEIVRRVRRFLYKAPPDKRVHDISKIVDEIAAFLNAEARRQEIVLRIRRSERSLKARVDRVELEQVIVNLAKNAFEAMSQAVERPKIVEISCLECTQNMLVIAVADSGPGVPEYVRESIFEPFFTTKGTGMGFGLAICSSLIESHGGEIRLGESWLGGALFEVILPLGDAS